jgi:hydrogenase maturation protease
VLGIGNILLQDEGLGVRAIERLLERYRLPSEVLAIDGGTMGLDLLPYLGDAASLLIVDAVQFDRPDGGLIRLEGDEIPATLALKLSLHQVGLQELLAASALQGTVPGRMVLWGIEPRSVAWGLELSPPVAARLDDLVDAVVGELESWGYACAQYA